MSLTPTPRPLPLLPPQRPLPPACLPPPPVPQMMAYMFVAFRAMSRLFGDMGPACHLPFEPPPFLQKVARAGSPGRCRLLFVPCSASTRVCAGSCRC